jgi:choice-of-anchor B domain-containing protein
MTVFIAAALVVSGIAGVAAAHEQAGLMATQASEFQGVAANAAEMSNAPLSHQPCIQGMAGEFPCDNIDLLSYVPSSELGASFVNDIWGWTDPETGADYALVGAAEGMVVVDISDPKRPDVLGILPTASTEGGDFWRDIKVYADHAFIVSENENHPMQVFDLTELRGVSEHTVFAATALYEGPTGFEIVHAHNININTDSGYAYIVGSDSFAGGLHIVDISDPANPTFAGGFADHGYTHDTQCVQYGGPDLDHQGRSLCFNSNAVFDGSPFLNTLSIVDVTDPAHPVGIANVEYPGDGYSHQGWLTLDQSYFLHNDELDELFFGVNTTTRIFDVTDLDNPTLVSTVAHDTTAIGHNAYTEGRYLFASNYTAGLRVFSTIDVPDGDLPEVAYFDVYPENDNASFEGGTWSNYPYFSQKGVVAVTGMDRGLFILQPRLGKSGN